MENGSSKSKGADLVKSYQESIPQYMTFEGIPFPGAFMTKKLENIKTFNVRQEDVLIAGYPRSGNHWLKEIVSNIFAKSGVSNGIDKHIIERCPIIEMGIDIKGCMRTYMDQYFENYGMFKKVLSKMATNLGLLTTEKIFSKVYTDTLGDLESRPNPRFYHTHLPFRLLPEQTKQGKNKVLYILRNGKDVAVSFYEMHKMYPPFGYYSGDWKEFYYTYLSGKVCFGSWFEHVKGWHEHRDNQNILFLHYEDMIEDLPREVRRISEFLELKLGDEEVTDVAKKCTFKSMQGNPLFTYDNMHESINTKSTSFLRKGKVGDWKSRMTVEDSEYFDLIYKHTIVDKDGPSIRFEL